MELKLGYSLQLYTGMSSPVPHLHFRVGLEHNDFMNAQFFLNISTRMSLFWSSRRTDQLGLMEGVLIL